MVKHFVVTRRTKSLIASFCYIIGHWSLRSHMRKRANQKDQLCKILCGDQTDRARVTLSELNSTSSTVKQELNMAQNELPESDALSEEREAALLAWDSEQDESWNADSTTALMAMMATMNENMTTVLKRLARVEGNAGKPPKQRRIVETLNKYTLVQTLNWQNNLATSWHTTPTPWHFLVMWMWSYWRVGASWLNRIWTRNTPPYARLKRPFQVFYSGMIFNPSLPVSRCRIKLGKLRQVVSMCITRPHGANSTTQKVQCEKGKHFPMAVSLFMGSRGRTYRPYQNKPKFPAKKKNQQWLLRPCFLAFLR